MKRFLVISLFLLLAGLALAQPYNRQSETFAGWYQPQNQWDSGTGYTVGEASGVDPDTLWFSGTDSLVLELKQTWPYGDLELTFSDSVTSNDSLDIDYVYLYQSVNDTIGDATITGSFNFNQEASTTAVSEMTSLGTYGGAFSTVGTFRPVRYSWIVIGLGTNGRVLDGNYVFATVTRANPNKVGY